MTGKFAILLAACLALPATAEELVVRQVLHEKPLSGVEGLKVVVSTLVIRPGGRVPLHTHPGDEHAVIVTGGEALMPDGREMSFPDGTPMFFAAGSVHGGVSNRGQSDIEIVTTHIVDEDKSFSTLAE
jgi:quercetin dioxygenase-like cupin family protein